jgi:polyisoprenoid-binding protein YceI
MTNPVLTMIIPVIMKKSILLAVLPALLAVSSAKAVDTYAFDKVHSNLGFEVRHLFSKIPGKFADFTGQIQYDEGNPEQSSVEVKIDAKSITTSDDQRDADLKSPNFFDVAKYPQITFKSKTVKKTGDGKFDVSGDFTMHGVTKEVVLKVELLGKGPGPKEGTTVSGWEATTAIKRSDYGLTWNKVIEGTQVVGDDVTIDLKVEADKK